MKHAVIIGGGMAGLVAAAVTARHFEKVTLIDKDTLPAVPHENGGAKVGHGSGGMSLLRAV